MVKAINIEIKNYINAVIDEVENTTISDYNLDTFDELEDFDLINFHLLNKHILENANTDLFIGIPEVDYRENFFESIFYSVTVVKLFQNYCAYQETLPELKGNDIIFTNNRIYKYLGIRNNKMILRFKFPKKNEKNSECEVPRGIFTKLDHNFDFQKHRTVECLKGYHKFLQKTFLNDNFPLMTEYAHKTLIISDKKVTKVNENIPFRYHSRNGIDLHNIPVDTLIEVCNSFTVAKNLIENRKIDTNFDEIIIVGDAKYREEIFNEILQCKWQGYFKSIILIGSAKPSTQNTFREWNWTKREIIIAHKQDPTGLKPLIVLNDLLVDEIGNLNDYLAECNIRYSGLDISYLLKFANFFLRQVIIGEAAVSASDNYLKRVQNHLEEKELDGLILSSVGYNQSLKNDVIMNILNYFSRLRDLALVNNSKWNKILSLNQEDKKIVLLVDKRQVEALRICLKANQIRHIKLVSTKKAGNTTLLDDWLKDTDANTPDKSLIVTYLNDPDLYKQLMEVKGKVQVLCYDKLDIQIFNNLKAKEENELSRSISHTDRNYFVNTKFQRQVQPLVETTFFKNIFDFSGCFQNSKYYNRDGEPSKEGNYYEITFIDGSSDILEGSKSVFCMEGESLIVMDIDECSAGMMVKYYKNDNKTVFNELLKARDSQDTLIGIEVYANMWREALGKLRNQFPNLDRLYKEIFQNNKVIQLNAFKGYFTNDSSTKFPQTEVLDAIYNCFKRNGYSSNKFMENINEIKSAASQNLTIRIKFGRQLSKFLSMENNVDLNELNNDIENLPTMQRNLAEAFIKNGVIKTIKLLSKTDARISIQPELNFQG
ncbi:MAG: hypothetical protein ABI207_06070, partial [Crocinitomicaceae bacterium]